MAFLIWLCLPLLSLISADAGSPVAENFCTESSVCDATVCPGDTFKPVCLSDGDVNNEFYIDLSKPSSFLPIKPQYSLCRPVSAYASWIVTDDGCPNINPTQLATLLSKSTNCFNRTNIPSCYIMNPSSLKRQLPESCFKADRELKFFYYCKPTTTTTTTTSTTSTTTITTTPTTTQKPTSTPETSAATTFITTWTVDSTKTSTLTYSSTTLTTQKTASTPITSVTPSVTTVASTVSPCPHGTVRQSTNRACTPVANVSGEACRQLAAASGTVYQTENGSCAQLPNSVESVSDTLKSTNKVTVRAQLLSKFAEAQNFSDIKDVSSFAKVLSEQLSTGLTRSYKPTTTEELQTTIENLLSTVTEFSSKGLWTSGTKNGSAATMPDSHRANMSQAADTVLKAVDNLGGGLHETAQPVETNFNSSGIGLSLRRMESQPAVSTSPESDITVRVLYGGPITISAVSVVTTSVNLPSLLQWLRPNSPDQRLISRVVQASLFTSGASKLPAGGSALFIVPHSDKLRLSRTRRSCVFIASDGTLSDEGCSVAAELSNETHTACLCRHLTSFAVIASPGDDWQSVETQQLMSKHNQPLRILTYACLSISVFSLMLTCFAYMALKIKSQNGDGAIVTLYQVHRALCATLMAAQLLFLVGFERVEYGKVPCQVLSALTVYCFLSVFAWLLVEAFMYTRSLVLVLPHANSLLAKVNFLHYCLICYLTPAIITAVIIGVRFDQLIQMEADLYSPDGLERPKACWLSSEFRTRWAFLGPMLTVCATNLILFIVILVKISRRDLAYAAHEQDWDVGKILRRQLRVSLTLGALLGLSWLISLLFLFAQMELLLAANYLFILLNGLQGCSILITQVLVHRRMRDAWERWLLQSPLTPGCLRLWLENRRTARLTTAQGGSNGGGSSNSRIQWQVTASCLCCCCLGRFGSSDSSKSTSAGFSDSSTGGPAVATASPLTSAPGLEKLAKPRPGQQQTLGDALAQFVGPVGANEPIGLNQPPMMEVKSVLFYDNGSCQRFAKVSHF